MSSKIKYFIGNWKMFGVPSSIKIIDKINRYFISDKRYNKKYRIIIAPPATLLHNFNQKYRSKKVSISAQNCFYKDKFGPYTGLISPFMIKKIGIKYIIVGHSENRALGETDYIIKEKIFLSQKNNLNNILCIGENKSQKSKKITKKVLNNQIKKVIKKSYNLQKIIIAYEPVWSIGTGKTPQTEELTDIIISIKKFVSKIFKTKKDIKVLYGGSVDKNSIFNFKGIKELDGFLIGGASKSSKNFIDIIKNFYK